MKKYVSLTITLALFAGLLLCSGRAAEGARQAMGVCAATLIPSLLPFFVLSSLLAALGLPDLLGGLFGGAMQRLFRISPAGAQAFFLGICGGYPLGASVVAGLRRDGRVSRSEAERLLCFCNNSGPAFILGAAGGVLGSPAAGLLLYVTHIMAAVTVGMLLRGAADAAGRDTPAPRPPQPLAQAVTGAVSHAVSAMLNVCGYVVLFGALLGLLGPHLALPPLANALVRGFLELGGGIAAMAGLTPTPAALAAAAFLLGWGGVSVHCQTLGAVADTDISCARHLAGRALCGVLAAVYAFLGAMALFQ